MITSSLCIALSRLDGADEHGAELAAKKALQGVALNPMPWSILLGGLSSALAWKPVAPVMNTIGLLADAASPVALFTIGAVLARSQFVGAAEEHGPMPARVRTVEYQGTFVQLGLDTGDREITAHLGEDAYDARPLAPGDLVAVTWSESDIHRLQPGA